VLICPWEKKMKRNVGVIAGGGIWGWP